MLLVKKYFNFLLHFVLFAFFIYLVCMFLFVGLFSHHMVLLMFRLNVSATNWLDLGSKGSKTTS